MKKLTSLSLLVACLFAFSACGPKDAPSPAILVLGFGSHASTAKSFIPEEIAVASIKVEGLGPGGERASATSSDCSPVQLELVPGSWLITAKGFSAKGVEVASGFLELSLSPSQRLSRDLALAPTAGVGSVSLTWSLSGSVEGALRVEGSLSSSGGTVLPIASPFPGENSPLRLEGLANGAWKLELRLLKDDLPLCGLADAVLVAAGMETKLSIAFTPPVAALSLGFLLPDYAALSIQVEPTTRRASRGTELIFRAPVAETASWYAEGVALAAAGGELRYDSSSAPASMRFDCVELGALLPRAGSASAKFYDSHSLGPLSWGELVSKAEGCAAAQIAMRALGDCRDLAWSADGARLAAAGKDANALSVFEASAPGAVFALSSLGGSADPAVVAPSLVRFLPCGSILALSESEGAAYAVAFTTGTPGNPVLAGSLAAPSLAGAKDAVVAPEGNCAYVASSASDAIARLDLSPSGGLLGAAIAIAKGAPGLESFARPYCLALSRDGSLLAVGTAGDDAIYLMDRDSSTNALNLRSRLDKTAFPASAPLSDPCSLAFSRDGMSLFVLSYYGKALIRLDRDAATGLYAPVASARSGLAGVSGFAYPKRLTLSPDGEYLALIGSGTDDGLAVFRVGAVAQLEYFGAMLPAAGPALPKKPSSLAFSPDGTRLAISADGYLSVFRVGRP